MEDDPVTGNQAAQVREYVLEKMHQVWEEV
jgi:hypothetical protein